MDRTSWIVVILCSLLMMFWWQKYGHIQPPSKTDKDTPSKEASPADQDVDSSPGDSPDKKDAAGSSADVAKAKMETFSILVDKVRYDFTNSGGGINKVELLNQPKVMGEKAGNITLNAFAAHPIGALSTGPGDFESTIYEVTEKSEHSVVFTGTTSKGYKIKKQYILGRKNKAGDKDSHLVQLQIEISNPAQQTLSSRYFLYAGAAVPISVDQSTREHPSKASAYSPTFYFWKDKGGFDYEYVRHFLGGMFSRAKPHEEVQSRELNWAGVSNQFYNTIIEPLEPADVPIWSSAFEIKEDLSETSKKKESHGIQCAIGLPKLSLEPGEKQTLKYEIYTGPKEFARLKALGDDRTLAMNYDGIPIFGWMFGWAIKPLAGWLIQGLVWLEGVVGQFGLAIVLITIMIRIAIWPIYAKSTRMMKRMSKLAPLQKELKEKYEDDPARMNQEIMNLYRDYNINPASGCLPMFIQMPVFLGFYRMLFSAVELRHESFFWVDDLSMPDTLFVIPFLGNLPFNLLPLLMAITMIIQMKMTPSSGDPMQRRIFMFMPIFFLFICYNFASALALYWTTQNIFSIGQTWLMNKLPEPELKKVKRKSGGGFLARMAEQAEAQKKMQNSKSYSERGERHTQSRSKKRKKKN